MLPDSQLASSVDASFPSGHGKHRRRRQLFHILHKPSPENPLARYVNYVLALLILFNCGAVALETDVGLFMRFKPWFVALEAGSTAIFLIEYLLRVWVCVEQEKFAHGLLGRLRYMRQPLPLLDLIVLVTFVAPVDLRFLRIFRISRLLRVLNLGDFDHSLQAILRSISQRRSMLLVSLAMMAIAIYFAASVLYIVEHKAQPDRFSSIPETLWWAVTTLTTIGYGDLIPVTPLGKFFASVIAVLGIGIFALPTAILTAAILDGTQTGHAQAHPGHAAPQGENHGGVATQPCPHCGKHPHQV